MPRKDRSLQKCRWESLEGRCSRPYCPFRHDTVEPPQISGPSAVPLVAPYTKTEGSRKIRVRKERMDEFSLSSPHMANSTFIDGKKENIPKWITCTIDIKKGLTPKKTCHEVEANNNEESEACPPKRTKLHDAAENGNLSVFESIMQTMLDDSVLDVEDFNPEDGEGQTPFHLAAKNGHLEMCRLIIANITDKNPINHDGETPFQLATYHGHMSVMELIKSALSKRIKRG
jgi:ankyrin repeat protein